MGKKKKTSSSPQVLNLDAANKARKCEEDLDEIIDFLKECLIDDASLLVAHKGAHLLTNRKLLKMKKEYARKTNALYETGGCPKALRQSLDEIHHSINLLKPFVKREIDSGAEGSVAQIILTLWACQEGKNSIDAAIENSLSKEPQTASN